MRCRRAISPILSVVILMGVAGVGGLFLSATQNNFLQVALSELEYKVTDLRVEKDSQGGCYLSLSLYNSGSETIRKTHLKTTGDSGHIWSFDIPVGTGLEPGNTTDFSITASSTTNNLFCGNLTISKTYSFSINGSSADSTFKILKDVKVKETSLR